MFSLFQYFAIQSFLYQAILYVGRYDDWNHLKWLVLRVKKLSQNAVHLIYLCEATPERFTNGRGKTDVDWSEADSVSNSIN